ncbi:peptide transporter family 1-like [Contarinia nasturtii]|uniref:peptide transporter family 1-like n=1 Tax=Contarinia nasturtii TaxID=265458 RepID=UPI0012D47C44|nr:peptide transporter family 1-like [Contarinia nasturtii]XP_031627534.1 peptide transporter family 1-like [Contarinia nasturtii]
MNEPHGQTVNGVPMHDVPQRLAYPKRVFLIIGNEFCERFNFYGLRTILTIYLTDKLGYSADDATVLYHVYIMLVYFMCIFGGILSDTWLGKFNTILYLSIVYSIGSVIVSVGAIPIGFSPKAALYIGLALISVGSGGIKPCVSAFGGDQFKLPEQAAQVAKYFSLFYFSINAGSLVSTTLTPVLREDVHCFGETSCYSLAFGVPAVLMILSILFFLIGKSSYTYVKTSSENMIIKMFKCICHAIVTKRREGKRSPHKNLLDYSIDKYGAELVGDIRTLKKILILYLPLPLFWSLFDQQGSRWTLQAKHMNGDLGFYTIKADQIQLMNPLMILTFIPAFEAIVYPFLNKIGLGRPLQRLTIGGLLAGASFFLSALVEFWIESSDEKSVNLLWQVPQYVVITMGEVMFSVTGLSFSYDQAPESMRSVVQAFWLLTVAFGNVIIVYISGMRFFESQAFEFILFGSLMFLDMFLFAFIARSFKSSTTNEAQQTMYLNNIEEKSSA